jgi:hypothetical protein
MLQDTGSFVQDPKPPLNVIFAETRRIALRLRALVWVGTAIWRLPTVQPRTRDTLTPALSIGPKNEMKPNRRGVSEPEDPLQARPPLVLSPAALCPAVFSGYEAR